MRLAAAIIALVFIAGGAIMVWRVLREAYDGSRQYSPNELTDFNLRSTLLLYVGGNIAALGIMLLVLVLALPAGW